MHELEPLDRDARLDELAQQTLRVGARRELDLESPTRIVEAADETSVGEHARGAAARAVLEDESDVARPVLCLDLGDGAIEDFFAARNDADRVAHPFRGLHDVRAEDDRLPAPLELDHR